MKKRNLKSLHVRKTTISNLNQNTILGGDITNVIETITDLLPQATKGTCSKFMACNSIDACSVNVCKTRERNTKTQPIC